MNGSCGSKLAADLGRCGPETQHDDALLVAATLEVPADLHMLRLLSRHRPLRLALPVLYYGMQGGSRCLTCRAHVMARVGKVVSSKRPPTLFRTSPTRMMSTLVDRNESIATKSVLVCGDGDLSFSAWLAPQLHERGVSLVATVLEDQARHHEVYSNSQRNVDQILAYEIHTVHFGIDATQLATWFPNEAFDLIQFNFPHWRGKANNKRNRLLLDAFLKSASEVLSATGEVHVALVEGQGGASATTSIEWKDSWMAGLYAAEHGLLLRSVIPYQPSYNLSSHRGVDRPFKVGETPELYQFGFATASHSVKESLQLCCRHELHLVLSGDDEEKSLGIFSRQGLVQGSEIFQFAQQLVPKGIRVEVPMRRLLTAEELSDQVLSSPNMRLLVLLLVYCGEGIPLTRAQADSYRERLEREVKKHVSLRGNRAGRLVSRPIPYALLDRLIKDRMK